MADPTSTPGGHGAVRNARLRLLLFSDLHLDTTYSWASPTIAETRREAARNALVAILGAAREHEVDAVVCAGDLFNRRTITPAHVQWLAAALRAAGVPILIAPGNADFVGSLGGYTSYEWPDNVTVFAKDQFTPVELNSGITVWGAGHTEPHRTGSFLDGFRIDRAGINLALFHGAERAGEDREPEADPCAEFVEEDIERSGFDHALVGHFQQPHLGRIHTYPGAPLAHDFGSAGAIGAVIVTIGHTGSIERELIRIESPGLSEVVVDLTGAKSKRDVLRLVGTALAKRSGVTRLRLTGRLSVDVVLTQEDLASAASSPESLLIDAVDVDLELERAIDEPTIRGQFVRDVLSDDLPEDRRRATLLIGMRAIDGYEELEGPR